MENLRLLRNFVQGWAKKRGLPKARRESLEKAAAEIFHYLVKQVYPPGQPGSITIVLEDKGLRTRLLFEDDAPAYNPTGLDSGKADRPRPQPGQEADLETVRQLADSLIYYRTADQKNRLVVFLAM